MNRDCFKDIKTGEVYRKITKPMAKKLFLKGKRIAVYPAKANPMSSWNYPPYVINRADREDMVADEEGMANMFEDICNSFSYYNCNQEMGKTLKYYEVI